MIKNGANINSEDIVGNTPLYWACSMGYPEIVSLLIKNNANLNIKGSYGTTPLFISAARGYLEISKLLIEAGADSTIKEDYEDDFLSCIPSDRKEEFEKLVEYHSTAPKPAKNY